MRQDRQDKGASEHLGTRVICRGAILGHFGVVWIPQMFGWNIIEFSLILLIDAMEGRDLSWQVYRKLHFYENWAIYFCELFISNNFGHEKFARENSQFPSISNFTRLTLWRGWVRLSALRLSHGGKNQLGTPQYVKDRMTELLRSHPYCSHLSYKLSPSHWSVSQVQ